jgi:CRP/FNR family transcriptional regulator, cyclic AMP receptor protein
MATVDAAMLRRTTVFSALSEQQVDRLIEAGEVTEHAAGETLTDEGSHGHRFHLILEGKVEVERGGRLIDTLGQGEFLGEVSLLGGGISTATVRCTEPTTCLTIWREPFWELLEAEPAIALRILEVVCRRLEQELRGSPTSNLSG